MNAADANCNGPGQLLGAMGRVESDQGRYGGNSLGKDGVSRPGIYGIALDGTNKTQKIHDTHAGQYDRAAKSDRAVGTPPFIPSTWWAPSKDADPDATSTPPEIDLPPLPAPPCPPPAPHPTTTSTR